MAQDLVDAEFTDDTGLYLHGTLENFEKTERAINVFCSASGARINWSKTMGFWVGPNNPPAWSPHQHFKWIPNGTTI